MTKKILVVDNNPVILELLSYHFSAEGHEVRTAHDGLSALGVLDAYIPDIMFVDLIMPNIGGDKLCRIVRAMPELEDTYLVILSAIVADEEVDFRAVGADACIAKGPLTKMREHIAAVLKGASRKSKKKFQKIIGLEGLHEREIIKELLQAKRSFEVILRNMAEGVVQMAPDRKIIFTNPRAALLFGMPEENLLSADFLSYFSGQSREEIGELLDAWPNKAVLLGEKTPLFLHDRRISLNLLPIAEEGNESRIAIIHDIAARKKAEEEVLVYQETLEDQVRKRTAEIEEINRELEREIERRGKVEQSLRESEGKYRLLVENQTDLVVKVDKDFRLLFVSPSYCRTFGKSEEELLGRNFMPLVHEADREAVAASLRSLEKPPHTTYHEERVLTALGWRWLGWGARAVLDSAGEIAAITGVGRDITSQKEAEAALQESESRFRLLYEKAPLAYQSLDVAGNVIAVNEAWLKTLGYARAEVLGRPLVEFLGPEYRDGFGRDFAKFKELGEMHGLEFEMVKKDGSTILAAFSGRVGRDIKGAIQQTHCIFHDITQQREAEKILQQSHQRLLVVLDGLDCFVYVIDLETHEVLFANRAAKKVFGDVTGKVCWRVFRAGLDAACENCSNLQFDMQKGEAQETIVWEERNVLIGRWLERHDRMVRWFDGRLVKLGISFDVTERKQAEEALQKIVQGVSGVVGESFFHSLVKHITDTLQVDYAFVGELSEDAKRVRTIVACYRGDLIENFDYELANTPCEEVVGKTLCSYPRDVRQQFPHDSLLQEMGIESYMGTPLFDSAGKPLGILVCLHREPLRNAPFVTNMFQIFAARAGAELERGQAEQSLKEAHAELERRVTERSVELEKIYKQLLHAEKLSAIGKLSASIAHEFNNPICGIKNVLEGLQRRASLDEDNGNMVNLAIRECDRIAKLTSDLQSFNRPTSGEAGLVDVHAALNEMLLLCKKELKTQKIRVVKRFASDLPKIRAVKDQLKQVFLNVLTNAKEAIGAGGGLITVSTEMLDSQVAIRIEDNGSGIREEDLLHIFEPFFSTKPEVKGTGLGLSVSYGIVKRHGGRFEVESEYGKGTKFSVILSVEGEMP